MYKLFRLTPISGYMMLTSDHMRVTYCYSIFISGYNMPGTYFVILPLLLYAAEHKNQREKTQTNKVISIVPFLKPCKSVQGKSTTIAWRWPSIEKQGNPRTQKKFETTVTSSLKFNLKSNVKLSSLSIASSALWIFQAYSLSMYWLEYLPHLCTYGHRSSQ